MCQALCTCYHIKKKSHMIFIEFNKIDIMSQREELEIVNDYMTC